jgi:hypothetical protein
MEGTKKRNNLIFSVHDNLTNWKSSKKGSVDLCISIQAGRAFGTELTRRLDLGFIFFLKMLERERSFMLVNTILEVVGRDWLDLYVVS